MNFPQRDLLVLLRTDTMSQHAIEAHVERLSAIVRSVENSDSFCNATELVRRNSITRRKWQIRRAARFSTLKPFHFFLNKN